MREETGKRSAAFAAAAEIEDDMLVGLGTGSTAAYAIQAIAGRHAQGLRVTTVATSLATAAAAEAQGLRVLDFADIAAVDLAIDGADEIDPALRAIKGGGGAMLREKIVAAAAARMVAIVDASKLVPAIGTRALPVEVLPFATASAVARLTRFGASVTLRRSGADAFRTDQGNVILDCRFPALDDPAALAAGLAEIPGMLGHGLFLDEIDAVYVGRGDQVSRVERGQGPASGLW